MKRSHIPEPDKHDLVAQRLKGRRYELTLYSSNLVKMAVRRIGRVQVPRKAQDMLEDQGVDSKAFSEKVGLDGFPQIEQFI